MGNFVYGGTEVKMQVNTGANRIMILSSIWEKLGRPNIDGAARTVQAYDGLKLYFKGKASQPFVT